MNCTKLLPILALTLPVFAQEPAPPPPASPAKGAMAERLRDRMEDRMATRLKLTDDQKAKIKDIRAKHADAMKANHQAEMDARKAFEEALKNPDTPADKLRTLHQAAADKRFEILLAQRAQRSEVRAILTPEQRVQADQMEAFHKGFMAGRGQGRGQAGQRPGMMDPAPAK